MQNDFVEVYTDGGIDKNGQENNIGTWAFTLKYKDNYYEESGVILNTTNNICELTAILKALRKLKNPNIPVVIYSDSKYSISALTEWYSGWLRKGWRTSDGKLVKNKELIQEIKVVMDVFRDVKLLWVRGHNGNMSNERVDELCTLTRNQFLKEYLGEFSEPEKVDDREEYERKRRHTNRIYGFYDIYKHDINI